MNPLSRGRLTQENPEVRSRSVEAGPVEAGPAAAAREEPETNYVISSEWHTCEDCGRQIWKGEKYEVREEMRGATRARKKAHAWPCCPKSIKGENLRGRGVSSKRLESEFPHPAKAADAQNEIDVLIATRRAIEASR